MSIFVKKETKFNVDNGKKLKKYLSDSNPRELIKQIKCRPGLYDKDQLEQPRREHKQSLWLEVAEAVTAPDVWDTYTNEEQEARVDEVQHKWKHLRNHFLREIKLIRAGQAHMKRKYIYYNDLEFMKPYVGIKNVSRKPRTKLEQMDESDGDGSDNRYDGYDDTTMDDISKQSIPFEKVELERTVEERKSPLRRTIKVPVRKLTKMVASTPKELTREQKLVINKFDGLKKVSQKLRPPISTSSPAISSVRNPIPSISMRDGDISFCLSLVPTMRKLDESKRLKAKIDILTILHKYVEPDRQIKIVSSRTTENNHSNDQEISDNLSDVENGDTLKQEASGDGDNIWWT